MSGDAFFDELNTIKTIDKKIKDEINIRLENEKMNLATGTNDETIKNLFKEIHNSIINLELIGDDYKRTKMFPESEILKRINLMTEIKENFEKLKSYYETQILRLKAMV